MTTTCQICGKEMETKTNSQKYCGDECRKIAKKKSMSSSRATSLPKIPPIPKCAVCGKILESEDELFCSDLCERIAMLDAEKKNKTKRARYKEEFQTVKEHCRHPNCRYRGSAGTIPCCDYVLIEKEPRGYKISECKRWKKNGKDLIPEEKGR